MTATICMILIHRITSKASKIFISLHRRPAAEGLPAWSWGRSCLYTSLSHRKLEPSGVIILLTRPQQHRREVGLWGGKQYRLHFAGLGCIGNHWGWLLVLSLGQLWEPAASVRRFVIDLQWERTWAKCKWTSLSMLCGARLSCRRKQCVGLHSGVNCKRPIIGWHFEEQ